MRSDLAESVGLLPHLNVRQNIGIVPRLLKWDQARITRRTDKLLELVGLDPDRYCAKYPWQLSGGEAQRIGVARALAADPPVLLMDEPFGAVDPLNRETLQNEFASIQRKLRKTVVFVTHDLGEAVRLARFRAGDFTESGNAEQVGHSVARVPYAAAPQEHPARPLWRVGASGTLVGLSLEGSDTVYHPPEPFWVRESGSLREALSLLLFLHVTHLAVVDAGQRFVGELSLAAIQSVTRRGSKVGGEPQEDADESSSS